MNKLIKGTLTVLAAGVAAAAAGFTAGVVTNLVRQVRDIKKGQALAKPLRQLEVMLEEYPNGGITFLQFFQKELEAERTIQALPEGELKTALFAQLADISQRIHELEAAETKVATPATQEGETQDA